MRCFILALLAVSALARPQDNGNKGGCPGGYTEGQEVERGRLVFACQGGQLKPKACIAEDASRVQIGSNYDGRTFRRRCEQKGDELSFDAVACLQNGQEHKLGDTWNDEKNVYSCKQGPADGAPLVISNEGCVNEGKQVKEGERVNKGDFTYECKPYVNNGHKLFPVGCNKDGKQVNAGDGIEVGKFWFNCSVTGRETANIQPAGCVSDGKRLKDGDRFHENDVVYECMVDSGKVDVRVTACVQHDGGSVVERKLGCTWIEGQAPNQYTYKCDYDEASNKAVKSQVSCNYQVTGGAYNLQPGCYTVAVGGNQAVGCVKDGNGLKIQTFQGDNAKQSAEGAGLRAC